MGFFKTLFTGKEETAEEKREQQEKNQFDVFKYDGIQAQRMGRTDYAIECYKRALDLKDDIETRVAYANALISKNNLEDAIGELKKVDDALPEDVNVKLSLAELYFQTEQYDEMNQVCITAQQVDGNLPAIYYLLAKMYKAQGDLINAVAQATMAIAKQTEAIYSEAYLLRAQLLLDMQQFAEAEADVDVILQEDGENDDFLMMKAQCCEVQQKLEEAKDYYSKVISVNPYVMKAYLGLGAILMAEGKKDEAARIVEEGYQMSPDEFKNLNGEYNNFEEQMQQAYKPSWD